MKNFFANTSHIHRALASLVPNLTENEKPRPRACGDLSFFCLSYDIYRQVNCSEQRSWQRGLSDRTILLHRRFSLMRVLYAVYPVHPGRHFVSKNLANLGQDLCDHVTEQDSNIICIRFVHTSHKHPCIC